MYRLSVYEEITNKTLRCVDSYQRLNTSKSLYMHLYCDLVENAEMAFAIHTRLVRADTQCTCRALVSHTSKIENEGDLRYEIGT